MGQPYKGSDGKMYRNGKLLTALDQAAISNNKVVPKPKPKPKAVAVKPVVKAKPIAPRENKITKAIAAQKALQASRSNGLGGMLGF